MTHQAKVVDKKQIADGAIAVTLRCCDDPATDSTATIYVTPDTELKSWLDAEKKRVQDTHAATLAAMDALAQLDTIDTSTQTS